MLAALGRLAHRRRRLIITLWSALLVLGFTVGVSVFTHLSDSDGVTASESARGMELLKYGQRHSAGVVAVVSGVRVDAPGTRNAVQAVTAKLEALPYVHEVHNAYNSPDADLTSSDGRTSIVAVVTERTTDMMAVQMRVDELRDLLHGSVPGATVQVGGDHCRDARRDGAPPRPTWSAAKPSRCPSCCSRCCSCSAAGAPPWCRWPAPWSPSPAPCSCCSPRPSSSTSPATRSTSSPCSASRSPSTTRC